MDDLLDDPSMPRGLIEMRGAVTDEEIRMEMRVPEVIAGKSADCQVRGFTKEPGDLIEVGEYLGELRVEYDEGDFTDCPVLYYGDLVARARGVLVESRVEQVSKQGDVLAIVGDRPGSFSLEFVTF